MKPFFLCLVLVLLAACVPIQVEEGPTPELVTLPPAGQPATPTVEPPPTPTATITVTETLPPLFTPTPAPAGPESASVVWQVDVGGLPIALDGNAERVAVLTADGDFLWLDANNGETLTRRALWAAPLPGETRGTLHVEGSLAVVSLWERAPNPETGELRARARLLVLDGEANTLWELPERDTQQAYSASLTGGTVLIGTWPAGFEDNAIGSYELFTGGRLWLTTDRDFPAPEEGAPTPTPTLTPEVEPPTSGYRVIREGEPNIAYALIEDGGGGALMAFSLARGDVLWRWQNRAAAPIEAMQVEGNRVFGLTATSVIALNRETGEIELRAAFNSDPAAGFAALGPVIAVAPAPTPGSTRPGLTALDATSGEPRWEALGGLRVDAIAAGEGVIWAVAKDFDSGQVWLVALNPETGEEQTRVPASEGAALPQTLAALGDRIYVLGEGVTAVGY